jgi:hypothetical protein
LNTIQLHIKNIDRQRAPLAILRSIHNVRDARSVLQLSQSDLGRAIGRVLGCVPLAQSTVANAEAGTIKLQSEYVDAIGRLLATWVTEQLGRRVGTRVHVNSPWRVTAFAQCAACGEWYELRRAKQMRCDQRRCRP